MTSLVLTEQHRVLHITLNRPEKRNALNLEMSEGIVQAIRDAQTANSIGTILLGALGPVFCAGMDLDEAAAGQDDRLDRVHEALFTAGAQSLKPIVIAASGPALGGGLGLLAQGHVVLASDGAAFGLPEIRVGLWPFLVYRAVSSALGSRRTLELSLTGQSFTAEQALAWGLVHRICPAAEIADRAKSLSRQLAKASPQAISCGMRYVRESREKPWEEAGEIAIRMRKELMASADFKEGHLAFKEKRDAHWPSMSAGAYGNDAEKRT